MSPTRKKLDEDVVSYALRLTLYATCVVLPFVALLLGRLEGEQTVAAVVTMLAAVGPVVAISQARTEKKVERQAYAVGLETGLTVDGPPHGRHRLEDRDDDERRQ